ncbi:MAG: ribose-5-phosphate isomerase RpiA [Candidatus Micrarchaeota archaeon]|nr:ribose-5-phosphate isomerase RpiA [Candidatus Micrarchaeota archaeon]
MDSFRVEEEKFQAAAKALEFIEDNMVVGLGTGSTADIFISLLGKKVKEEKLKIECVATSSRTKNNATNAGLKIVSLDDVEQIDIAVDGADRVDKNKNLIKGYGGALVREKIVAYNSEKFVVIVDSSKISPSGVLDKEIPIEYVPFARAAVFKQLKKLGVKKIAERMEGSQKFVSDNQNWLVDAYFGEIKNPSKLEEKINSICGIVENGIFSKKKPIVICAGKIL